MARILAFVVLVLALVGQAGPLHGQQLVTTTLLTNATTGSGCATQRSPSARFKVDLEWGNGTSAGVVAIETAHSCSYTGTWSNLTSFTWAAADSIDTWRGTGPMVAIRARITTTVTTVNQGVTVRLSEN